MQNLKINSIGIYHPAPIVKNDFYLEHFKKQGKDIRSFFASMGRDTRFIDIHHEDTALTMAIKASESALEKAGLAADSIDLIIFTTQTPETLFPTNAVRLFHHLNAKPNTIVYDMNANCAGMTVALEQASHYMASNKRINRALIVGSDMFSTIADKEDAMSYGGFGDAACAMILERTDEDSGYIDSEFHVDTIFLEHMMLPAEGFAKGVRETGDLSRLATIPFNGSAILPDVYTMFDRLFERNGLEPKNLKYCFSQFAQVLINSIKDQYNLSDEQVMFISEKYGYTGTSSPIMALQEGIENGQIQRGDTIMFWTVGTGHQLIAMLYKY